MKLAVINFSGNVGKTTVARHLLAPRIPGCQVVAVESINADDGPSVTIRGRQFAQLQEFLQGVDNVVIDIGASNVEDFLKLMRRYRDSQEDFDDFIVPYAHGSDTGKVCGFPHFGDVQPDNIGRTLATAETVSQINALRANPISRVG
jgi:hypothetical protein